MIGYGKKAYLFKSFELMMGGINSGSTRNNNISASFGVSFGLGLEI